MSKIRIRFVIALLTFLLGVAAATMLLLISKNRARDTGVASMAQQSPRLRLIVPDAAWEPFFFNSLDEHTKKINLPSLRTITLAEDDLEVRFWHDALPSIVDGVILRRSDDQWSGVHLHGTYEYQPFRIKQKALREPKSGWKATWEKLVNTGILTLPDASAVQCHSGVIDGVSYVVEININTTYRTYRYSNPQFAECSEARQMALIGKIIADEFDLWNSSR